MGHHHLPHEDAPLFDDNLDQESIRVDDVLDFLSNLDGGTAGTEGWNSDFIRYLNGELGFEQAQNFTTAAAAADANNLPTTATTSSSHDVPQQNRSRTPRSIGKSDHLFANSRDEEGGQTDKACTSTSQQQRQDQQVPQLPETFSLTNNAPGNVDDWEHRMYLVLNRPKIKKEDTLRRIQAIIQEDSEITGLLYFQVQVKCQITTARILHPVKYRTCSHIQCFELDAFLKMVMVKASNKFSKTKCPICDEQVRFEDLAVDELFGNLLCLPDKNGVLDKDCDFVRIHQDGSWEWDTAAKKKNVKITRIEVDLDEDGDEIEVIRCIPMSSGASHSNQNTSSIPPNDSDPLALFAGELGYVQPEPEVITLEDSDDDVLPSSSGSVNNTSANPPNANTVVHHDENPMNGVESVDLMRQVLTESQPEVVHSSSATHASASHSSGLKIRVVKKGENQWMISNSNRNSKGPPMT